MYFFISNYTKVFLPKNCHRENEFFLCTTQGTTRNPKNSNSFLNALNMKFSVDSVKRGTIVRSNKKRTIFYNKICLFLSLIGLLETSFLTLSKINGQSVICSNQNCSIVLSSVFSSFLDIPFSTIGLILYFLIGLRAFHSIENNSENKNIISRHSIDFIFHSFSLQLSFFGLYFVFVLEQILKTTCPWCYLSIFLSGTILIFSTLSFFGDKNFDLKSFFLSIFFMAILVFIINCFNIIELQTY